MYIVITSSPNADGLTAACGQAAAIGFQEASVEVKYLDLCALEIGACRVCGNGWGTCRNEHRCIVEDKLSSLLEMVSEAEGIILVTPVYWGQPSERMKSFMDRSRRLEALKGDGSAFVGKKIALVAAAGGSGNGTISCLEQMEAWTRHVSGVPFERIGVTRFNRESILPAVMSSAYRMAKA